MPIFATPEPISALVDLSVGNVRAIAGDRTDTVVEVRPNDPDNAEDVKVAGRVQVSCADGRLEVRGPKLRSLMWGMPGAVHVTVELPAGSSLRTTVALGDIRAEGRLGDCRLKTSTGDIEVEETARLDAHSGTGNVLVHRATGHAELGTGTGDLRIYEIDGTAVLKNSTGESRVGDVTGEIRIGNASGDITIDRAHSCVHAKTASGDVRIGEVMRDTVVLETAAGDLEVGIREGSAAWLVLNATTGQVHNSLSAADGPGGSTDTVEVRARTYSGDITIRRS